MNRLLGRDTVHILEMVLIAAAVMPHRLTARKVQKKAELRVYQGVDDVTPKYPYVVVSLILKPQRFCTGTLIAPEWVLTAAHCCEDDDQPNYIQYGKLSIPLNVTDTKSEVITKVRHPRFDYGSRRLNDIALLRVSPGVRMDKYGTLSAVDYSTLLGLSVEYVGGGRTYLGVPKLKKWITDQLRPLQIGQGVISPCPGYICVAPRCSYIQQVLPGDSGGPLLVDNKIVGVAKAYSLLGDYYGIFTPISPHVEWIYNVINSIPN